MKTVKKTITAALVLFMITLTQSCVINGVNAISGDGNVESRSYEIDKFNVLKLGGSFNVIITEGTQEKLVIKTDENLYQYLNVESGNNVLSIYSDRDIVLRPTKLEIHLTYTALEQVLVSGACKLKSETTIRSDSFMLNISGAGAGELDVEAEKLRTKVSGAASLTLTGTATTHEASLSGASSLKANDLITENTVIKLSGAGSATVHATETLDANLSGVGSIKYSGDPKTKQTDVSGIGRISSDE